MGYLEEHNVEVRPYERIEHDLHILAVNGQSIGADYV